MKSKNKRLAAIAALSVMLTACSGGPSKGDLKDGIAANLKDHPHEACWSVANSANVTWPMHVPINQMNKEQLGVVDGLTRSGIVTANTTPYNQGDGVMILVLNVDLTQKGKEAKAWDSQKGFCVGTRQAQEVTEFTLPGKGDEGMTSVKYTWTYGDLPSWVDKDKYPKLAGMGQPVPDEVLMQKTNNGWRVQ